MIIIMNGSSDGVLRHTRIFHNVLAYVVTASYVLILIKGNTHTTTTLLQHLCPTVVSSPTATAGKKSAATEYTLPLIWNMEKFFSHIRQQTAWI